MFASKQQQTMFTQHNTCVVEIPIGWKLTTTAAKGESFKKKEERRIILRVSMYDIFAAMFVWYMASSMICPVINEKNRNL